MERELATSEQPAASQATAAARISCTLSYMHQLYNRPFNLRNEILKFLGEEKIPTSHG